MAGRDTVHKVVADCPLNLYLIGPDGSRWGYFRRTGADRIERCLFINLPYEMAPAYTEMMYPANAGYTLVLKAQAVTRRMC